MGLRVKKITRTGKIKEVIPTKELLNLKAFMKYGVRTSTDDKNFMHWLPVYLDKS